MGRAITAERAFEEHIANYLNDNTQWIYEENKGNKGWDISRALYVPDTIEWLKRQYPKEYENFVPSSIQGDPTAVEAGESIILDHLLKELGRVSYVDSKGGKIRGGLLGTLREGFVASAKNYQTKRFGAMMKFEPHNPKMTKQVGQSKNNIFRVLRQVRFSPKANSTLDMVLLVNGIPVVTMELKVDTSQSVDAAITQYKNDRRPTAATTLLAPGRALVHFAVSDSQVYMTTKLAGRNTKFLPFNKGRDGHAGNPLNPHGYATSYLWEEILTPEMLAHIISDYAIWEPDRIDKKKGTIIFPRYHQMRAVEKVVHNVATDGVGGRYLIQHSAGSGKTKTLVWLANRFLSDYAPDGTKFFDSVIIVSDRNVLDTNIKRGLSLLQSSRGSIVNVSHDMGSKSVMLRDALTKGNRIINCTIQTFPALKNMIEEINKKQEQKEKKSGATEVRKKTYAVIMDEAHSSQSGAASKALRENLSGIDTSGMDADEKIAAVNSAIAMSENISFVAFTATPKHKTLELFGTRNQVTGETTAFDSYHMAQAIEEGFILDVLKRFSEYSMYAKIVDSQGRQQEVDKKNTVSTLSNYVTLHPHTIEEKADIAVKHFIKKVSGYLDGDAKAMIVTSDRRSALAWYRAVKKKIKETGNADTMDALVAFSGALTDKDADGDDIALTERGLNGVRNTENEFKKNPKMKFLIVANKFQVGFDEPRLCSMYVDKEMHGILAVQTLSRLNRVAPGKPDPIVLDFYNTGETILKSFQEYYKDVTITENVAPSQITALTKKLAEYKFYTEDEILAVSALLEENSAKKSDELSAALEVISSRWQSAYTDATNARDNERLKELREFKKRVSNYYHAWDFLSQIFDYKSSYDSRLAEVLRSLYGKLYEGEKRGDNIDEETRKGMSLIGVKINGDNKSKDLRLSTTEKSAELLTPGFVEVSVSDKVREMTGFDEAVEAVNEMFHSDGISVDEKATEDGLTLLIGALVPNDGVRALAIGNDATQLSQSRGFVSALFSALFTIGGNSKAFADELIKDKKQFDAFAPIAAKLISDEVNKEKDGSASNFF